MEDGERYQRSVRAVSANVDGEEILLDSEVGVYFSLNEVASDVWQLLEKPATLSELVAGVCDIYEIDEAACRKALIDLIEDLRKHRLIESQPVS
mgnify:CR=1 FL=1